MSERVTAVLQALFVTFLWSTSWVLIKIGLEQIPALTFAGLRYSLAFLCLVPPTACRLWPDCQCVQWEFTSQMLPSTGHRMNWASDNVDYRQNLSW